MNKKKKINLYNSFKRLDRFGDENSKSIKKIKDACLDASKAIAKDEKLKKYFPDYTIYGDFLINIHGRPLDERISREDALSFAKDVFDSGISESLLDEEEH